MESHPDVIFVDDEEDILNSLNRLFVGEDFEVKTTKNAEEVLRDLEGGDVKVVVSDYRMPGMSGVELLRQVKEKKPDCIRILFTGYADIQAAEKAINISEVYRFISKPWDGEELKMTIVQAINHYDLKSENEKLLQIQQQKNNELRATNKKLEAMFEKQRGFTSTVSHELRTPLASIKTAIDIVNSGTAGNLSKQQKSFLGKAKDNVDRLNRLINDILDLSKIESGTVSMDIRENNLSAVCKTVAFNHANVAKDKGLKFAADYPKHALMIPFDKDKISQVLDNLLNNAIKFTDKGSVQLIVKQEPKQNVVLFKVVDTGPGIEKTDIKKLFHKFQQLGDPATRKTGGTGLGLAICKEIVNLHDGEIWVESVPGKGSRFCFTLPVNQEKEPDDE